MFARLEQRGVKRAEVTLHVGIGTFRPVEVENVDEHVMEEERYHIPAGTAAAINEVRTQKGRILAIGSTSVRTLESAARENGELVASEGRTGLFIRPGYRFRAVDAMLTNFHLPRSTLIMMVCAFAGRELIMRAYREAVEQRYRFYSYGDCMLIV
jgi:S-adenosylmethionine:tRNA ribosyltransferase-isomerase